MNKPVAIFTSIAAIAAAALGVTLYVNKAPEVVQQVATSTAAPAAPAEQKRLLSQRQLPRLKRLLSNRLRQNQQHPPLPRLQPLLLKPLLPLKLQQHLPLKRR